MSVKYFDQLLGAAHQVHVVYLAQLLGAVLFMHFIYNHDITLNTTKPNLKREVGGVYITPDTKVCLKLFNSDTLFYT